MTKLVGVQYSQCVNPEGQYDNAKQDDDYGNNLPYRPWASGKYYQYLVSATPLNYITSIGRKKLMGERSWPPESSASIIFPFGTLCMSLDSA